MPCRYPFLSGDLEFGILSRFSLSLGPLSYYRACVKCQVLPIGTWGLVGCLLVMNELGFAFVVHGKDIFVKLMSKVGYGGVV